MTCIWSNLFFLPWFYSIIDVFCHNRLLVFMSIVRQSSLNELSVTGFFIQTDNSATLNHPDFPVMNKFAIGNTKTNRTDVNQASPLCEEPWLKSVQFIESFSFFSEVNAIWSWHGRDERDELPRKSSMEKFDILK